MRLAVITGATGFTGPYVVRALRRRFHNLALRCVVRPTSDRRAIIEAGVTFATADLRDAAALCAAFEGADTLVNVASLGFDWTDNVLDCARAAGIRRAVFISTTAILTRLAVPSKAVRERSERLVRESGLDWTILRPTMIYGTPGDRNIARLIRIVERSPVVPLVAPRALQQPVHVADVAAAVAAVLGQPATIGRVYNLSGADALTLEALVRTAVRAAGRRRLVVRLPLWPVKMILGGWSHFRRPPITVEQLRRIEEDKNFDHSDAAAEFGYAPRTFADGILDEVRLVREGAA